MENKNQKQIINDIKKLEESMYERINIKKLEESMYERIKLEKEITRTNNKSIIITTTIIMFTIITSLFLYFTIGKTIQGEMTCKISGLNYESINEKVLEQYNNPKISLQNSTIDCTIKGEIPIYAVLLTN